MDTKPCGANRSNLPGRGKDATAEGGKKEDRVILILEHSSPNYEKSIFFLLALGVFWPGEGTAPASRDTSRERLAEGDCAGATSDPSTRYHPRNPDAAAVGAIPQAGEVRQRVQPAPSGLAIGQTRAASAVPGPGV